MEDDTPLTDAQLAQAKALLRNANFDMRVPREAARYRFWSKLIRNEERRRRNEQQSL